MAAQLSAFHRLAYAGVDLSLFSKQVKVKVGKYSNSKLYHAYSSCWGTPRPSGAVTEEVDRATVVASKGCGECFDDFFADHPAWHSFSALAGGISNEDARFLRTVFNERSRKNTLEVSANQAARLEEIKRYLTKPTHEDAVLAYDALIRRIDDRARELRANLRDETLVSKVSRAGFAIAACASLKKPGGLLASPLREILRGSYSSFDKDMWSLLRAWAESLSEGKEPEELREGLVNSIKSRVYLQTPRQLSFRVTEDVTIPAGASVLEYVKGLWTDQALSYAERLVAELEKEFSAAREDKNLCLAHVRTSQLSSGDSFNANTATALVELFTVVRADDAAIVLLPASLISAVKEGSASSWAIAAMVEAVDVTQEVAFTAASLYDVGSQSDSKLMEALEAAKALEVDVS